MVRTIAEIEWGDVPAWVGAVLTGSSLLIAAVSYRTSVRTHRDELVALQRKEAATVSAWKEGPEIVIENGNDTAATVTMYWKALLDSPSYDSWVGYGPASVAPKGRVSVTPLGFGTESYWSLPTLAITDSAGNSWLKSPDGHLQPMSREMARQLQDVAHRLEPWTPLYG